MLQEFLTDILICQIETEQGLKNADEIAAIEGVDAIFFGADDMSVERGLPMDKPRPKGCYDEAIKAVAQAAANHGKFSGGVFANPEALSNAIAVGHRFIVGTADSGLLANASKQAADTLRKVLNVTDDKTHTRYQWGTF